MSLDFLELRGGNSERDNARAVKLWLVTVLTLRVFSYRSRFPTGKIKPFIKGGFPSLAPARFSLGLMAGRGRV
ncbi:MAG: hypothetical protein M3Q33_07445, partial [Acidobacteriota bacterium]|nr:hypothetical protein [Acidobacteriota bacterium]